MSTPASRSLLLACARLDGSAQDQIALLANGPLDWSDLVKGITWHGLAPLAAASLGALPAVPTAVKQQLTRLQRVNAFRSLHLAVGMRTCVSLLEGAGMQVIPWKGPALAHDAYGDLTLRTSCDIDLLVQPGEVLAAAEVLLRAGFLYEDDAQALTPKRLSRMTDLSGEVRLWCPDKSFLVELHQQFSFSTMEHRRVLREMWSRSSVSPGWDGRPTRKLAVEDLLLTLCVHATKHGWDRLKWVVDIAAVVNRRGPEIRWTHLLHLADRYDFRGMLLVGLALAHRNCGAALPPQVIDEVNLQPRLRKMIEEQDSVYITDGLPRIRFAHSMALRAVTKPYLTRVAMTVRESLASTSMDVAEFPGSDRWLALVPAYRVWRLAQRHVFPPAALAHIDRMSRVLTKWAELAPGEKQFILRATMVVFLVRMALWLCTFKRVLSLTEEFDPPAVGVRGSAEASPERCARWIPSVARIIPKASCLTQALAAKWLLRSTNSSCELQLGVGKQAGKFSAHAVLLHEGNVVVGGRPLVERMYERIFSC